MRIIVAACVLAFFGTSAIAESPIWDDAITQYTYTFETLGSQHVCNLATVMTKAPRVIKLTAAFIYDDKKPKGQDLTVAYIVEAFVRDVKTSLDTKQVKVVAGRIISDIFNSDLHATKNIDKDLGASYNVSSGGSRASLLTNLMTTRSAYTLVVEFENNSSLTVNVKPTPEISGPSEKWMNCLAAFLQHQRPPQ
jgi:hypothetical protein